MEEHTNKTTGSILNPDEVINHVAKAFYEKYYAENQIYRTPWKEVCAFVRQDQTAVPIPDYAKDYLKRVHGVSMRSAIIAYEAMERLVNPFILAAMSVHGYADHDYDCRSMIHALDGTEPIPCTCGYSDARKHFQSLLGALTND